MQAEHLEGEVERLERERAMKLIADSRKHWYEFWKEKLETKLEREKRELQTSLDRARHDMTELAEIEDNWNMLIKLGEKQVARLEREGIWR